MHTITSTHNLNSTSKPEPSWLKKALSGDSNAFEKLVSHYQPRVMRLTLRFFKNTWDAEDACQNIFLKVFLRGDQFQYKSSFGSWLYRLAYNECLDEIRRNRKIVQRDDLYYQAEQIIPLPATPKEQTEFNQQRETVLSLIKTLPPILQDTLVTLDFKGLPLAQASALLQIKESTLRVRHHRAFKQLKLAFTTSTAKLFSSPTIFWEEVLNAA